MRMPGMNLLSDLRRRFVLPPDRRAQTRMPRKTWRNLSGPLFASYGFAKTASAPANLPTTRDVALSPVGFAQWLPNLLLTRIANRRGWSRPKRILIWTGLRRKCPRVKDRQLLQAGEIRSRQWRRSLRNPTCRKP